MPHDNLCKTICACGCITMLVSTVLGALFSLSVTAVIIHDKYGLDECIGTYGGISFGYDTWLEIYGWTNIALLCFFAFAAFCGFLAQSSEDATSCVGACAVLIAVIGYAFQFCWYIVGAILYFQEVNSSCAPGKPLHDFGLALFIIQTIVWGSACLGGKSQSDS